jgi:hypothetical protein
MAILSRPVGAIDQCTLLGDHAVMFAQWKSGGKPLKETLKYIDESYRGMSMHNMYRALAQDIYNQKRKLTPRAWRIAVEDQCKEASGAR